MLGLGLLFGVFALVLLAVAVGIPPALILSAPQWTPAMIPVVPLAVAVVAMCLLIAVACADAIWATMARVRLRKFEEATAQRSEIPVPMLSRDLTIIFHPRHWEVAWAPQGLNLAPEEARQEPPRPERWTRLGDIHRPALFGWVDEHTRVLWGPTILLAVVSIAALLITAWLQD